MVSLMDQVVLTPDLTPIDSHYISHWLGFMASRMIKCPYITLWWFNIAMENGSFIDGLPIKSMVIFHGYVK
jgi:hypothetical protein